MISLLELSSNIGYIIIISFTVKTSYATLVQFMFLYMLLLPYAFLMNTSHNKNRIVEYGWKNVFGNLIMKLNNSVSQDDYNNDENAGVYSISKKLQDRQLSVTNDLTGNSSQIHHLERSETENVETFNKPSSSKGTSIPMVLDIQMKLHSHESRSNILIEKRFISKMREHVDDEMAYLESFKDFIAFQEHCKDDKDPDDFKAEREIKYLSSTKRQSKNLDAKQKMKRSSSIESEPLSKCKDIKSKEVDKETNTISGENERIKRGKRIHLLECLKICSEHNSSFDFFKEQLIDLEESFINY